MSLRSLAEDALPGSSRARHHWLAATVLLAAILTAAWAVLDLRFAAQTGLVYEVYPPGSGLDGEPVAQGVVAVPALRGDGVSPRDERRLTRGAGRREVRWSGQWFVSDPGPWELFAAGSGEIVVRVDGELVVSTPGLSDDPASGTVQLERGFHRLVVWFARSRPGRRPWMVVHRAPLGEAPRPFDPGALLPQRADEQRYAWNRRAAWLRDAGLAVWGVAFLLLVGPWVVAGLARLTTATARLERISDALTVAGVLGSGLFMVTTLFQHEIARSIGPRASFYLNLQGEGNLAAWWSGMLLLLAALYAVDAAAASPPVRDRPGGDVASGRLGWACLALVLGALSADEIGVFHEHVWELVGWGPWWSLAPFALLLAAILAVGLAALWRVRSLRRVTLTLLGGVAVLGIVPPALEVLEHVRDWGIAGHWWHPYNLRGTVEEGSELLGVLILLHACAWGRRRMVGDREGDGDRLAGPEAATMRGPLLLLGWPLAIGVALLSPALPPAMAPEAWLASAIFFLVAVRAWFHRDDAAAGHALGVLGLIGSVAGTLFPFASFVWLVLSVALAVAWIPVRLRGDRPPGTWLPVLCLVLGLVPLLDLPVGAGVFAAAVPSLLALTALALAPRS